MKIKEHDVLFNKEHDLNITKQALIELLRIATKNQLFQFEGNLYEQVDGVAMGSPLGPLMANAFMCNIEKQLETENKMPAFYKRYVDDTLSAMPDVEAAIDFLTTLNNSHPSIDFTMELEENGRLPFLGMNVIRNGCYLNTTVYRKPTDTGLLLHYHSHVDARYKRSLINTMLNRAFKLSSTWKAFHEECERFKEIFSRLCYPEDHVQSTIRLFVDSKVSEESRTHVDEKRGDPIRVVLPFKDQKSANAVRRQLADLSRKISADITPVYTSKKIKEEIRVREEKPPLVSQHVRVNQEMASNDFILSSRSDTEVSEIEDYELEVEGSPNSSFAASDEEYTHEAYADDPLARFDLPYLFSYKPSDFYTNPHSIWANLKR
ncbi:uncharacterized protein [Montipora foliosa]|uniref:uncharacterized protein n=1 Tax=Montipora foliosa TaxID=591990 RepID=UPI0035F19909